MSVLSQNLGSDVHVWTVRLRGGGAGGNAVETAGKFRSMLSARELDRSARFSFDNLRHEYVVKHGVQRTLLGQYLEQSAKNVGYEFGEFGKPRVVAPGNSPLTFNQSDSSDLAVFAFARGLELGIDVEQVRQLQNLTEISQQYFAPEEYDELCSLPEPAVRSAFFRTWTRKEAYVKALGKGLHFPLRSFQVTARGEPRIVHIGGDESESSNWQIHSFVPAKGYVGAVVYRSQRRRLRFFGVFEPCDFVNTAD